MHRPARINNPLLAIEEEPLHDNSASEKCGFRQTRWTHYAGLLLVIVLFAGVRFRLRNIPLERDEGEFAYVGQLMLEGISPYKLAASMKLPGTYVAYALIMELFGASPGGIHLGLLLVNSATIIFAFLLGKCLYGPLCGIVSACTYGLLSSRLTVLGFSAHATHFVVFFALAGILAHLFAQDSGRTRWTFVSGLLAGAAFLMKQPGIFFALFLAIDLARLQWRQSRSLGRLATAEALFVLGTALPFLATCLSLAFAGVFRTFWFWTFTYARAYASLNSLSSGADVLRQIFIPSIAHPPALWIVACLALPLLIWNRETRSQDAFVAEFTLFSALAVAPGLYFRPHYFILMLPVVSLLVGISVSLAGDVLRRRHLRFLRPSLPAILYLLFLVVYLFGQRKILWQMSPLQVCRDEYPGEPFIGVLPVADYIRTYVPQSESIAILGSEPEIAFYSQRHSAALYLYTRPLSEAQPYSQWMQQQFMRQIEAARPMALIDVDQRWYPDATPPAVLAWMRDYVHRDYELGRQFPFDSHPQSVPPDDLHISVYLRREDHGGSNQASDPAQP
jgi:hypothetical protein